MTWKAILAGGTLAAGLVIAAPAPAQSVFDGTWKIDTDSASFGGKPIVRSLKNGIYRCVSCATPFEIAADGAFHPIAGNPYVDQVAVTVVDPTKVDFRYRKDGKVVETASSTVSADGRTLTSTGVDNGGANGTPIDYSTQQTRIGTAPAGEHAISGSWRNLKGGTVSDAGLTVTFKTAGDALTMSYPTGESVTATFGGPAARVEGDPSNLMVRLVRKGRHGFVSTGLRDGKVVQVVTVTVRPDGRTLAYTADNALNGSTQSFVATKR